MTTPTLPPLPTQPRNGLGTAGFVLGLLGFFFSFIPFIGVIAWPLVVLGLVLSLVGLSRTSRGTANNKGLAIAGVVLSALGLLVCVLWVAVFGQAASDLDEQADREQVVVYEVTGDAPSATVTYSTFSDGTSASSQETVTTLPWRKELTVKGLLSGGSLTVTTGQDGGSVGCKITVDGVEKKSATGNGAFSSALCGGF
ncbi:MmpS family transport accessory protein [Umezawaea tangerina]|uniref:MmpS family membrane protein n=1 Tax=Umezawaea tangerina TaxID=84725 RepID=A0A2T0TD03_9PSEU|nr:MmpS family transport accessory protein [Umezawaea tangerina]PRY43514.1 MmpS family membrane protein [Umezawaea tangerina]